MGTTAAVAAATAAAACTQLPPPLTRCSPRLTPLPLLPLQCARPGGLLLRHGQHLLLAGGPDAAAVSQLQDQISRGAVALVPRRVAAGAPACLFACWEQPPAALAWHTYAYNMCCIPNPLAPPAPSPPPQGDTFNLLGALLKGDQLPTVVFTAQYFICVDAVMMVQVRGAGKGEGRAHAG